MTNIYSFEIKIKNLLEEIYNLKETQMILIQNSSSHSHEGLHNTLDKFTKVRDKLKLLLGN